MKKAIAIAMILLFSFVAPADVSAQGSNKAAAEALFQQGVAAFKANKYEEAADKFDASHKLDPAIGALLYLGEGLPLALVQLLMRVNPLFENGILCLLPIIAAHFCLLRWRQVQCIADVSEH